MGVSVFIIGKRVVISLSGSVLSASISRQPHRVARQVLDPVRHPSSRRFAETRGAAPAFALRLRRGKKVAAELLRYPANGQYNVIGKVWRRGRYMSHWVHRVEEIRH